MKIRKIGQQNKWLLLALILLLGGIGILQACKKNMVSTLYSQQEAQRWENEIDHYTQVTAFFDARKGMHIDEIAQIENQVLNQLSDDGYLKSEHSEKTWLFAYSGEGRQDIRYQDTTMSVSVMGIGGDFFQFHPIPLKSGSYLTKDDINGDRVVIDNYVAWTLYGSYDVVGMKLNIGERCYTVAGVTEVPEDALYAAAYGAQHRIYLNFNELSAVDAGTAITSLEAVLPNPITNYGYRVLAEACDLIVADDAEADTLTFSFDDTEVIENTTRFGLGHMLDLHKNAKYRVVKTNGIAYPFWENIARVKESSVLAIVRVQGILLFGALIVLVVVLVRGRRVLGDVNWKQKLSCIIKRCIVK